MTAARAAVLRDPAAPFTIEDVELPSLARNELLIRLVATGMCHSDLVGRTLPQQDFRPVIFGHEGAGIVEAAGDHVRGVRVGDPVVLSFDSCGRCRQCRAGDLTYCVDFIDMNSTGFGIGDSVRLARGRDGEEIGSRFFSQSSFASHAIATDTSAVVVPADLDLELLGPLGCGFQTGAGTVLNCFRPHVDDAIAVFGVGAVGLAAVMAARALGVSKIAAVDLDAGRLRLARELGATITVDGADPDVTAQLLDATGGVQHALDTTGNSRVAQAALASLDTRGTLALVGAAPIELKLSPIEVLGRTITYLIEGNSDPQRFIPAMIDLWRKGRFPFEKLTHSYPFEAINDAEQDSVSGRTVKPILVMD